MLPFVSTKIGHLRGTPPPSPRAWFVTRELLSTLERLQTPHRAPLYSHLPSPHALCPSPYMQFHTKRKRVLWAMTGRSRVRLPVSLSRKPSTLCHPGVALALLRSCSVWMEGRSQMSVRCPSPMAEPVKTWPVQANPHPVHLPPACLKSPPPRERVMVSSTRPSPHPPQPSNQVSGSLLMGLPPSTAWPHHLSERDPRTKLAFETKTAF